MISSDKYFLAALPPFSNVLWGIIYLENNDSLTLTAKKFAINNFVEMQESQGLNVILVNSDLDIGFEKDPKSIYFEIQSDDYHINDKIKYLYHLPYVKLSSSGIIILHKIHFLILNKI